MSKEFWKRLGLTIIISFLFVFAIVLFNILNQPKLSQKRIKVSGNELLVEIADSKTAQIRGLQYRKKLKEDQGMLFIFDKRDFHSIWMKGMNFSIDILWISNDQIVYFEQYALPDKGKRIYRPKVLADKILEVSAGFMEKNNLVIGAILEM